jgi:hypothetical protein
MAIIYITGSGFEKDRNQANEERYPAANYPPAQEIKVLRVPGNSVVEYFDSVFQTDVEETTMSVAFTNRLIVTGSVVGGGWNDASASAAGVPVGGMYYTNTPTTGSIKVRLT